MITWMFASFRFRFGGFESIGNLGDFKEINQMTQLIFDLAHFAITSYDFYF